MYFQSSRLVARRFAAADLPAFIAMRNDPHVARYQSWDSYTLPEAEAFLKDMDAIQPGDTGWFQFALTASGDFIGDLGFRILEDPRLAQIGYTIARTHWGKGYATEAVKAFLDYAFAAFPLHRITASVDPRNPASCRVLEKAGFRREALFRESEWFRGEWADDAIYALLRADHTQRAGNTQTLET